VDNYPEGRPFIPVGNEPREQKDARNKERAQVMKELPILEKTVKSLQKRIEASDSVKITLEVAKKYDLTTDLALKVCDVVRQQLEIEKEKLDDLIKTYKR
jgi:glycerol-3-phosphate dehydrogenase